MRLNRMYAADVVLRASERKRKSKFGRPLKLAALKASQFVGVKMTEGMLRELEQLVAWGGVGVTRSSVIVGLIHQAWSRGDPRQWPREPSPEEREAAIAVAHAKVIAAKGEKATTNAMIELERLRGEPPHGGKS